MVHLASDLYSTPKEIRKTGALRFGSKIFRLNLACYQPLAISLPRLGAHPHATFESDKELALVASFQVQTCWPASVAFQVVLMLPEA
jgi:hypothetical protein